MNNHSGQPVCFALIGAGFWAQYQLAAWGEIAGPQCIAIVDRDLKKAQRLCDQFGISHAYDEIETMFERHQPLFVDIVTNVESHASLVYAALEHRSHAICQKPLAGDLQTAVAMATAFQKGGFTLNVHENWRWQRPIRELQAILAAKPIGRILRAQIDYNNSFPVFDNQPNLKELSDFILADMGTHIFDVARFLCGEPRQLYCQMNQSRPDIRGEDLASMMCLTENGVTVICNLSYASKLENDRFPETRIRIEGESGSLQLDDDFWISLTTNAGTLRRRYPPPFLAWADPRYALVHSSMVACQENLLRSILGGAPAETTAADNLKTLAMVEASYESARQRRAVEISFAS